MKGNAKTISNAVIKDCQDIEDIYVNLKRKMLIDIIK